MFGSCAISRKGPVELRVFTDCFAIALKGLHCFALSLQTSVAPAHRWPCGLILKAHPCVQSGEGMNSKSSSGAIRPRARLKGASMHKVRVGRESYIALGWCIGVRRVPY